MRNTQQEILHFWFEELAPQQWFQQSEAVDASIRDRFSVTYNMAVEGLSDNWAEDVDGSLALVIVFDQFPRHMFRGEARAFVADELALTVAKQAINKGFHQVMEPVKRGFLYLPFQHSENLEDQKRSVELYGAMAEQNPAGDMYAKRHLIPIEKFGRFPHRNKVLGRKSTPEENEFLKSNGGFL
jgi:uncharacterized protein (DUF924 family)